MKALPNYEIDGRRLYYSFVAGAKKILENQNYLNKIVWRHLFFCESQTSKFFWFNKGINEVSQDQ